MNTYFVINLQEFELKKDHPYTIFFKATCTFICQGIIELEYTGPELKCKASLPSDYMDKVCKEMQSVFGYGPFNKSEVKKAMNKQSQFRINQCDTDDEWPINNN